MSVVQFGVRFVFRKLGGILRRKMFKHSSTAGRSEHALTVSPFYLTLAQQRQRLGAICRRLLYVYLKLHHILETANGRPVITGVDLSKILAWQIQIWGAECGKKMINAWALPDLGARARAAPSSLLLQQKVKHNLKFHVSYVYDKKI